MFQENIITPLSKPYSLLQGLGNRPVCDGAFIISCKMDVQEIWKDVIGYEGIYQISNFGKLKSFKKDKNGRILSNVNKNGWYLTVVLSKSGNKEIKTMRIHRMVAEYFIPNPDNKPEVNHKDMNKQNNHVDNLEWCTRKENGQHSRLNKPESLNGMIFYNKHIRPNEILQYDLAGNFIASYANGRDAHLATGVCQRNILQVAHKTEYAPGMTRKQAGGFIWKIKSKI